MIKPTEKNTFCYYPFYSLVFKMYEGQDLKAVAPCCMMHDTENTVLSKDELKNLTPNQIFNHEKFESLRKNLLNNVRDSNCATCWKQEDKKIQSHRLYSRWPFEGIFDTKLREIDISLSNKCNLACRMCNVGSSHQLWDDVKKLEQKNKMKLFDSVSNNSLRSSNLPENVKNNYLIQWIYHNTDQIKILKASGGEPLYDKNIIRLLKKFVRDGNSTSTELALHTNAMLLSDEIIQLLNKFKLQRHSFSIDGVDSTYDFIRHKSNFTTLERNIKNWLEKSKNIYIVNINFVLSSLNLDNIIDFLEWTIFMFFEKIRCNVFISEVRPAQRGIDIKNLPIEYLKKIQTRIYKFRSEFEFFRTKKYNDMHKGKYFHYEIDKLLSLLDDAIKNNIGNVKKLKDEITLLDETRNQSYKDYLNKSLIKILDDV